MNIHKRYFAFFIYVFYRSIILNFHHQIYQKQMFNKEKLIQTEQQDNGPHHEKYLYHPVKTSWHK